MICRANSTRAELTNGTVRKVNQHLPTDRNGFNGTCLLVAEVEVSQNTDQTDTIKSTTKLNAPASSPTPSSYSPVLVGSRAAASSTSASGGSVRMTIMLLSVSFTFMLTTLPMTISNIMANTVVNIEGRTDRGVARWLLVHTFSLLLMYLNHSVNFLLYCVTGKKFRKVVTRMYSAKVCGLIQRRSPETTPLDHSDHLYCSRRNGGRCGADPARFSSSPENHV
ncbi:FMRFamide receptor-like [Plakobranchus ocellatus]|uniref:FMRFamide receptor-like n=1 Tax=Plakobranchus ocellatus TaxID=259542 RepID=A0AAV4DH30_9GAST|nr:FMRFamide receptor-like [Plakobranchus ocellatus]